MVEKKEEKVESKKLERKKLESKKTEEQEAESKKKVDTNFETVEEEQEKMEVARELQALAMKENCWLGKNRKIEDDEAYCDEEL